MIQFFKRLYPLLDRPTKRRLGVATVAMLFLAVLEALALVALVPLLQILTAPDLKSNVSSVTTVSDLLGNPSPSQLAIYLALFVFAVYIVKSLSAIAIMRWTTTFALVEESNMVYRVMNVYMHARYSVHLERNSSEFIRTLTESFYFIFRSAFVQSFNAVGDLFSMVFIAAILAITDPVLAVVAGSYFLIVTVVYQALTSRVIGKAADQIHHDQATYFRRVNQSLTAVKEIKVRGVEDYFATEVYETRAGLMPAYRTMALLGITPRYVLELAMITGAGLVAVVAFSTQSVASATATIGVFIAGGFRILAPLNKVIFGNSQARAAIPSVDQLNEDLDLLEHANTHSAEGAPHLEWKQLRARISLRDVSFSYVPKIAVLNGVTLDIEPGEAIGLVGGSGAGKSTLVDMLLGLLDPDDGEILIDGWPIAAVKRQWQQMIGYVPQAIALFDDTVRANVALGVPRDEVDDARLQHALAVGQLEDVVMALPKGLDNMIGESGVQLSGGQRQRLGVARALYHDPQVLMFDEATSALDNETEFKLTEVLEGLRGRLTTITIAHRLSTVRRCDRLVYLDQGRVVAIGTFSELNDTIPGFARMVELATLKLT
jgi:ATP-binding cassette, subfamily B, bacterial PglK